MAVSQSDLHHILSHTTGLWEELRGQRLFIAGGTGFFGQWLLESFAHANRELDLRAEVVVLTRSARASTNPAILFHTGDIRNFTPPAGQFSHIIHAATAASQIMIQKEPFLMASTILDGTKQVLDLARTVRAKKLLFASSGAIYGPQPPKLKLLEESFAGGPNPLDVHSVYGEAKRMGELLCALAAREMPLEVKVARGFAFVGPYLPLDAHYAIGNFIRDALHGGPIQVQGDGSPYRSYLYAADLAIWLWTILLRGEQGTAYNVGSDQAHSIAEIAQLVATPTGTTVKIAAAPLPDTLPSRYVPSIRRAAELGLRVRVPLEEAIVRTIDWHRGQH